MGTDGLDVTIQSLRFDGDHLSAGIADVLTGCDISRTIDGCPTLTVTFRDKNKTILRSGLLSQRLTAQFDTLSFEMAQVKKAGFEITATFEDIIVATLRKHKDQRKADAGTTSRVDFVKMLIGEEPWIPVYVPPGVTIDTAKAELARGTPDQQPTAQELAADPDAGKEDTWTAAKRIMDEIGWRVFSDGHQIWIAPETWLIAQDPAIIVTEASDAIDNIDFDWDVGKPIATASVSCRAKRWGFPPGSVIRLADSGPADGNWIVSTIARSAFSATATIDLTKARPVIPEPEVPEVDSATVDALTAGDEGADAPDTSGAGLTTISNGHTVASYVWPLRGIISAGFGMVNGHTHEGVDISVEPGTSVVATRDGTIDFAGNAEGYGDCVFINHGDDHVYSRYGFLSKVWATKGNQVKQGSVIGLSGGSKDVKGINRDEKLAITQGPHLHFEIRVGNKPYDPMVYLKQDTTPINDALTRAGRAI